jgi:hypothetical protein
MKQLFLLFLVLSVFVLLSRARLAAHDVGSMDGFVGPIELIFSHNYHITEEALECSDCHDSAAESRTGADNLFPPMDVCGDCHDIDEPETCATCHSDTDDPRIVPRIRDYSQKFSHETHVEGGLACLDCHAEVAAKETAAPFILPTMVACVDCHEQSRVDTECQTCHLPGDRLKPRSHTVSFRRDHSDQARTAHAGREDMTCQTCHNDDFCQDCHEGENLDRMTHPLNFAFTHALQAQSSQATCVTCHSEKQFCIDCHSENQIMPHTHRPGWVNRIPGDGGRHRVEAINDLETCMACHETDADWTCASCHGGGR